MTVECGPTVPQILVNVAALAFGGLIGYLSSARISRLNARLAASIKFRAAVLKEIGSIYPLPANWPKDIADFLRAAFLQLQVAVAEFRPFVPKWRRRAFDRAWASLREEVKALAVEIATLGHDLTFSKTIVPVRLAQYEGEKLVARSQAKRLIARFERFRTVVLDFEGVEEIGQGFADEVFRVFQLAHPGTELIPIHVRPDVETMIKHVLIQDA